MHDVMNMASSWRLMRSLCMVSAVVVRHLGFFLRPSLPIHCMGPQVVSSFDSSLPSFGIQQRFCIDMLNKRPQPNIQPHPAREQVSCTSAYTCTNMRKCMNKHIHTRHHTYVLYTYVTYVCSTAMYCINK